MTRTAAFTLDARVETTTGKAGLGCSMRGWRGKNSRASKVAANVGPTAAGGLHDPHPAPVQEHEPFGQFAKEQCAPMAHCSVQPPDEQSRLHVEPAAHAAR